MLLHVLQEILDVRLRGYRGNLRFNKLEMIETSAFNFNSIRNLLFKNIGGCFTAGWYPKFLLGGKM